jgi:O-Antigen ligase
MRVAILAFLFGVTIAKPRWSLYLILLSSPLLVVYQSVGWDLRLWLACFLGMRVILTASGAHVRNNIKLIVAAVLYFVVAEIVLQVRSSAVPSDDAGSAQQAFAYFLAGALFAFAASQLMQNTLHLSRALICVGIAVSYTTGYALWERFFASTGSQLRIGSTLINPNVLGAYAGLCAITLLMARRLVDKRSWRLFIGAVFFLSVTAVFLSLSRASALALAPGLVLLWATRGSRINAKRILAAVAISALVMAILFAAIRGFRVGAAAASERSTEIEQSMEDFTRYEAATYSLEQWTKHPLFGVGFMLFAGINYQNTGFYVTTHDTVLQLLVGTGLFGIVLLGYIAAQLWKKLSKAGRFAFLPVVVCFFINSLFGDHAQALELTVVLSIAYLVANRTWEPMANFTARKYACPDRRVGICLAGREEFLRCFLHLTHGSLSLNHTGNQGFLITMAAIIGSRLSVRGAFSSIVRSPT